MIAHLLITGPWLLVSDLHTKGRGWDLECLAHFTEQMLTGVVWVVGSPSISTRVLLLAEDYSTDWTDHSLFIYHLWMDMWLFSPVGFCKSCCCEQACTRFCTDVRV